MKLRVRPGKINGEISVPGSKSHTIRALAVALMADGESEIRSPLVSGDTMSCLDGIVRLGADVERGDDGKWLVSGVGGKLRDPGGVIDLGNSGTSLCILAGLAGTASFEILFDGDASLRSRPMEPLLHSLRDLGAAYMAAKGGKCPIGVRGPIRGGNTRVDGKISQYLSSLLFASPLAERDTIIKVQLLNEKPYVEMSVEWLAGQGIQLEYTDDLSLFHVKGGQGYRPFSRGIPADFSTATFPLAAAAATGGRVVIHNLDFGDHQGDKEVFSYFEAMGVKVERGHENTLAAAESGLQGIEIDLNATPDALPAMAAAAAAAAGVTCLRNVAQARIKETDRIACMCRELRAMGVKVEEFEDGMEIYGGGLRGAEVDGHGDHRIVMALAVAGLAAEGETIIHGAEAAAVTYPNFVADFQKIGADIEIIGA